MFWASPKPWPPRFALLSLRSSNRPHHRGTRDLKKTRTPTKGSSTMAPFADEPRLMAAFEMLVDRLSSIEAELRGLRRASEYRDDCSEPGMIHGLLEPDSAMPFSLNKGYSGMASGLVYVTTGCDALFCGDRGFDCELHRPTLEAAWGAEVAARAIAADDVEGEECARCEDVGIAGRQEYVFMAKQEVVLKASFPDEVVRMSPCGIWLKLSKPTGVRDLLRLLRKMAAVVGATPPEEECTGKITSGSTLPTTDPKSRASSWKPSTTSGVQTNRVLCNAGLRGGPP